MNSVDNPYVPGAGFPPPALVGRDEQIRDAKVAMQRVARGTPSKSAIFIGLRGVGKTVLLLKIKEEAQALKYKAVMIESEEDKPLPTLLAAELLPVLLELSTMGKAVDLVKKSIGALRNFTSVFKISIHGVGFGVKESDGPPMTGNLTTDLTELIRTVGTAAKAADSAIVLLLDEIQYLPREELASLIQALHKTGQERLPVIMFGAGLSNVLERAGEAKSYAERLFTFPTLGALDDAQAGLALTEPAKGKMTFAPDALATILRITEGYPYFLQQWGYQCWECTPEAKPVVDGQVVRVAENLAIPQLDKDIFRVRYDRTTEAERKYMRALADFGAGPHPTAEVAKRLGKKQSSVGPARDGLIKKGVIFSPEHGKVEFSIPLFHEFMKRMMPAA